MNSLGKGEEGKQARGGSDPRGAESDRLLAHGDDRGYRGLKLLRREVVTNDWESLGLLGCLSLGVAVPVRAHPQHVADLLAIEAVVLRKNKEVEAGGGTGGGPQWQRSQVAAPP